MKNLQSIEQIPRGAAVVIYGAGREATILIDLIAYRRRDLSLVAQIIRAGEKPVDGIEGMSIETLVQRGLAFDMLVVATRVDVEIERELADAGCGQWLVLPNLKGFLECDTRERLGQLVRGLPRRPPPKQIRDVEEMLVRLRALLFPEAAYLTDFLFKLMFQRPHGDPAQLAERIGFMFRPSYNEDRLITDHVCHHFLEDPLFKRAYEIGMRGSSMKPKRWKVHAACWAAQKARDLPGDFVECGVFEGVMSRAVAHYVDFAELDKTFYLLDTYEGLPAELRCPEEKAIFGAGGKRYRPTYAFVRQRFSDFPNIRLVKGRVPDTLARVSASRISYLSLDLNVAPPEIAAAGFFWDKLVSGAVMLIDDYATSTYFRVHTREYDRFAREKGVPILTLPTGQGLIIKP